jgi:hypothetical protein
LLSQQSANVPIGGWEKITTFAFQKVQSSQKPMFKYRVVILLMIAVLLALPVDALAPSWEHSKWLSLPMQELITMADKDFTDGNKKDTALVCYTIVSNRYEPSMSHDQKVMCKDASMRLWSIYFYDFYDYPKCFDCLGRALEIADDASIEDANIYLGFGCMYQTISEECRNPELGAKALEYYQQALTVGLRTHDDEHTDMASTDVLAMAHTQGGLSQIEATWQQYLQWRGCVIIDWHALS